MTSGYGWGGGLGRAAKYRTHEHPNGTDSNRGISEVECWPVPVLVVQRYKIDDVPKEESVKQITDPATKYQAKRNNQTPV
jgi:1,4-alpha-glucan branching enzyme